MCIIWLTAKCNSTNRSISLTLTYLMSIFESAKTWPSSDNFLGNDFVRETYQVAPTWNANKFDDTVDVLRGRHEEKAFTAFHLKTKKQIYYTLKTRFTTLLFSSKSVQSGSNNQTSKAWPILNTRCLISQSFISWSFNIGSIVGHKICSKKF